MTIKKEAEKYATRRTAIGGTCIDAYTMHAYMAGAKNTIKKALDILDDMFMEQSEISVDDWFRDSKNFFQGRKEFIKRMEE